MVWVCAVHWSVCTRRANGSLFGYQTSDVSCMPFAVSLVSQADVYSIVCVSRRRHGEVCAPEV